MTLKPKKLAMIVADVCRRIGMVWRVEQQQLRARGKA